MSDEKPLHVRMAEALGCKIYEQRTLSPDYPHKIMGPITGWYCHCPDKAHGDDDEDNVSFGEVLRYDTDWSATGPLIEKYVGILCKEHMPERIVRHGAWAAQEQGKHFRPLQIWGDTALIAVCNLILALKKAGKL